MFKMNKIVLAAAAVCTLAAGPAYAEVVELKFTNTSGSSGGSMGYLPSFSGAAYPQAHVDYYDAALNDGTFDFTFTYDTDSLAPNYDLTLVSGRLGTITDFSGFTATLDFQPGDLLRLDLYSVNTVAGIDFKRWAYFLMADSGGEIGSSLPTSVDFAALDMSQAMFSRGWDDGLLGTGRQWVTIGMGGTVGAPSEPGGGPISAVPEPATWAMMILGFGLVGTAVRRRGRLVVRPA